MLSPLLQVMRFPHPAEVGLLNTLPPRYHHLEEPRAALCLVGQLAAPLQALWVFGHVKKWSESCFLGSSATEPDSLLESYKAYLIQQRTDLWLTPSMLRSGTGTVWLQTDSVPHAVTVQGQQKLPFTLGFNKTIVGSETS